MSRPDVTSMPLTRARVVRPRGQSSVSCRDAPSVGETCAQSTQPFQRPQQEVRMNSKSMAGWIGFAGLVMLILGGINFFQGLIAAFEDDYYLVTQIRLPRVRREHVGLDLDGLGPAARSRGHRVARRHGLGTLVRHFPRVAELLRKLGFLGNSNYPLWALTSLALNVIVLFALTARWDEPDQYPTTR